MFENKYDIAYKLLIAVFILMALYSIIHMGAANVTITTVEGGNVTNTRT